MDKEQKKSIKAVMKDLYDYHAAARAVGFSNEMANKLTLQFGQYQLDSLKSQETAKQLSDNLTEMFTMVTNITDDIQ